MANRHPMGGVPISSCHLYFCGNSVQNISEMCPKNFWKISHPEQEISRMSPNNLGKISHQEEDISLYLSNFSKEVSQLTDRLTYKKFRIIWN